MGLYQYIRESSQLNIYSSGFWNFVSGPTRAFCASDCQGHAALYEANSKMFVYGFSTINSKNLILHGSGNGTLAAIPHTTNPGTAHDGFGTASLAAYFGQSA